MHFHRMHYERLDRMLHTHVRPGDMQSMIPSISFLQLSHLFTLLMHRKTSLWFHHRQSSTPTNIGGKLTPGICCSSHIVLHKQTDGHRLDTQIPLCLCWLFFGKRPFRPSMLAKNFSHLISLSPFSLSISSPFIEPPFV